MALYPLPRLRNLPDSLPLDKAVRIELVEGVPVFKASQTIQDRIEELLRKQREARLKAGEETELDRYEEMDDYLSFVNRVVRNLMQSEKHGSA
ncbi:MAG: hypothetical protein DYG87_08795 [Anaerolineae bacterium CFX3]|nr:hypothetical protein [Anaerolineae bacterium]MBL1171896.1 hypothetical protein [Chloroflexota bacterium]MBW7917669.1 hypothetical protein [Anaerolineales bacterium]MCE7905881.1 hypothetical protein [Anaerolineae bacterium CFX3]MDL1925869.1 hypothetical protein [Anaerolineae bacterium AMX1]OQY84571.1 MAG: hypothetical protein B6D40_05170 [Anaerolineae bacterium UTCFX3]